MVFDCRRSKKDSCGQSKGGLLVCQEVLPSAWEEVGQHAIFLSRFAGERFSCRCPECPHADRRKRMCLQPGWMSGQLQEIEFLEMART